MSPVELPTDTNAQLAGEELVYLALKADADLEILLTGPDRIFLSWPDDTLTSEAFPRVSVMAYGTPLAGGRRVRATVRVGMWGWEGMEARVAQMDIRVERIFRDKEFLHAGFRVSTQLGSYAPPVGGSSRIARVRDVIAMVSEVAPAP